MDGELEIIEGDLADFLDLCMANLGNLPQSRFHRWAETLRDKVALWQTFNPIHKAASNRATITISMANCSTYSSTPIGVFLRLFQKPQ